jgi:hypothetical protein
MTRNEIVQALRRKQPFIIITSEGQRYLIPHPEWLALPPDEAGDYVIAWNEKKEMCWLDLANITTIQFPVAKP